MDLRKTTLSMRRALGLSGWVILHAAAASFSFRKTTKGLGLSE